MQKRELMLLFPLCSGQNSFSFILKTSNDFLDMFYAWNLFAGHLNAKTFEALIASLELHQTKQNKNKWTEMCFPFSVQGTFVEFFNPKMRRELEKKDEDMKKMTGQKGTAPGGDDWTYLTSFSRVPVSRWKSPNAFLIIFCLLSRARVLINTFWKTIASEM